MLPYLTTWIMGQTGFESSKNERGQNTCLHDLSDTADSDFKCQWHVWLSHFNSNFMHFFMETHPLTIKGTRSQLIRKVRGGGIFTATSPLWVQATTDLPRLLVFHYRYCTSHIFLHTVHTVYANANICLPFFTHSTVNANICLPYFFILIFKDYFLTRAYFFPENIC